MGGPRHPAHHSPPPSNHGPDGGDANARKRVPTAGVYMPARLPATGAALDIAVAFMQ